MRPASSGGWKRYWGAERAIALATFAIACLGTTLVANDATGKDQNSVSCHGLHAGIRAEVVGAKQGYTEDYHVMLTFVLLNDSDSPIDAVDGGWKLVIDGVNQQDSAMIFGNGIEPSPGWGVLHPGESYEFGKTLPLTKYFPRSGDYRVSWRGNRFQSATIRVAIDMSPR